MMIRIIIDSNIVGCEKIMPEHKVVAFLRDLRKSYIRQASTDVNAYLKVKFIKLKDNELRSRHKN